MWCRAITKLGSRTFRISKKTRRARMMSMSAAIVIFLIKNADCHKQCIWSCDLNGVREGAGD